MSPTRTPADHAVTLTALADRAAPAGETCGALAIVQPIAEALTGAGLRGDNVQSAGDQLAHGPIYIRPARGAHGIFVIRADELARLLEVHVGPPCELTAVRLPHNAQRELFLDEDQALAYADCHDGATVTGEVVIDHTTAAQMIAAATRELEQETAGLGSRWIGQEVIDTTEPTGPGGEPRAFTVTSIGRNHGEPTLERPGRWCYVRSAQLVDQPARSTT
jgi:hypothetical protein